MEKKGESPSAPAGYSAPGTSGVMGGSAYVEADNMQEINLPPSYDTVFTIAPRRSQKSNPYTEDDRNLWEKAQECFEMSIPQQIIWLIMLAFSISYIFYGATKIFSLYNKDFTNYTSVCHPEFYDFYYNAKIGQLAVLMPYAAYILIAWTLLLILQKRWFIHHKWRQWVRLLDAEQDGIISADDMEKTNAKLEQIRTLLNGRDSALSEDEQKKWWNNHVFKRGPGKDISLEDYISYLEGLFWKRTTP
ncbi:uncharacterized protein LOC133204223 [Saccostrea echinata]|uniref:uncharacterized protein LOC133204223 n=1 Tax=Saccostrea echinata TaxID=191078 RepID=UPI002A83BA42|nr:uncharacterized protein LOC133204223 [Saccostrea echinata]